jgi:aminopeptidase S
MLFTQPGAATNRNGAWSAGSWNVSAFAGQSVRVLIEAADAPTASLVEAGIDDVKITRR